VFRDYYLNLSMQPEGEYEIHIPGCDWFPSRQYEYLGRYQFASTALDVARRRHPGWAINGCIHCCPEINTD